MGSDVENISEGSSSLVLSWRSLSVKTSDGSFILQGATGDLRSGQMLAILGPSGAGKSTFLDVISGRNKTSNVSGSITLNASSFDPAETMSYVEQEDALLGVLTVRETITFAARLSHDPSFPASKRELLVEETIATLGLSGVANHRIGTPIQRGVSGGQKRRVTIACSVVARPRILVLDEPTSGLDSKAAHEVLDSIKALAIKQNMIVICTIHQPNWQTFCLFDGMLLLAKGRTIYRGSIEGLPGYLAEVGHPVGEHVNPADAAINLVNTDFDNSPRALASPQEKAEPGGDVIDVLANMWNKNEHVVSNDTNAISDQDVAPGTSRLRARTSSFTQNLKRDLYRTGVLIGRNFTNYRRNLLAYGIRVGMYIAMGVLLATIWVNMPQTDPHINDRLSVHFFSVAFLSFMSVSGIPAFLEERAVFKRERHNGLYGPGPYVLANSIVNLPFLFVCSLLFSVICYWSIGLHPGATHFFRFLAFIFIAVYTAESQSVLVAAVLPIFVAALAIASFMNGFWMCVQGYFIRSNNLPRFWYYWAHWIDYQTFAFNILSANDLRGLVFPCTTLPDGSCQCAYASTLVGQCAVAGQDVLNDLGIGGTKTGLYVGVLFIITVFYRVLFYLALVLRK